MQVPRRILFIHAHGGIGDLLLSSPIAEAIARSWPGASVSAWVPPRFRCLLDGHPWFSDCLSIDGLSFAAQWAALRRRSFDAAILAWTAGREAALAWMAGIPVRVGQSRRLAYSWTFTHRVDIASARGDTSTHWLDIQLGYARALGCNVAGVSPTLALNETDRANARALLAAHGVRAEDRPCGLHIFKALPPPLTTDRWPVTRFVDVGRRLVSAGRPVVLLGSLWERPLIEHVASAIGEGAVALAIDSARDLAAVIREMTVVITPDSGPGHIAAALDVPVVAIFAVKADIVARWRPWTKRVRVVTTAPWVCPKQCVKERCTRFDCLEAFDAEEVTRAAIELADEL